MPRCQCPACGHEWNPDDRIGKVDDDSPEGLAQLWCFHLTRRKLGGPRDLPQDIAPEMANLIDMGIHPARIRTEILRKGRDRSEYMWNFRQRFGLGLPMRKIAEMPTQRLPHVTHKPPSKEQEAEIERAKEVWRLARGIGEIPQDGA